MKLGIVYCHFVFVILSCLCHSVSLCHAVSVIRSLSFRLCRSVSVPLSCLCHAVSVSAILSLFESPFPSFSLTLPLPPWRPLASCASLIDVPLSPSGVHHQRFLRRRPKRRHRHRHQLGRRLPARLHNHHFLSLPRRHVDERRDPAVCGQSSGRRRTAEMRGGCGHAAVGRLRAAVHGAVAVSAVFVVLLFAPVWPGVGQSCASCTAAPCLLHSVTLFDVRRWCCWASTR